MNSRLSILAIGSEILDGRIQDTNSSLITQKLSAAGFSVVHALSCGDVLTEINSCIRFLHQVSDVIVVSGGLGPTDDDLTREAVATYAGVGTEIHQDLLEKLKDRFARRGIYFDPSNVKQAMTPSGARVIDNPVGSAAGFAIKTGKNKWIISLPGVPRELVAMLDPSVMNLLGEICGAQKPQFEAIFRVFGLTESELGGRVKALGLNPNLFVAYQTSFPENKLVLRSESQDTLQTAVRQVRGVLIDGVVYSEDATKDLSRIVHELLVARQMTLSIAESCTGGQIAKSLTDHAGSSAYLLGGVVSYSNPAKVDLLSVEETALKIHGAVSFKVARQMASGCRKRFGTDLAVSVTGVAGPDGGSIEKPVGTVFLGLSTAQKTESFKYVMSGSRDRIRTYATWLALDLIRRHLQDISPNAGLIREENS